MLRVLIKDLIKALLMSTHKIIFHGIRKIFTISYLEWHDLFFFQAKSIIFSYFSAKLMLWVLIRNTFQGTSEYPQHMVSWRNKKNIYLVSPLIQKCKLLFFMQNVLIFFLFLHENLCCGIHQKHLIKAL